MNNPLASAIIYLLPFLVLFPGFFLGGRTIFIFEILLIIFFITELVKSKLRLNKELFIVASISGITIFFGAFLQLFYYGSVLSLSLMRLSFLLLLVFYLSKINLGNPSFIKSRVLVALVIATLIAYAQIVDNLFFGGAFYISDTVAKLYPYRGELSERGLDITGGLSLKTNSVFSPTSIADGHTILAGNFFALSSIIFLFWKKPSFFILAAVISILTFSRGSWLMLVVGIAFWLMSVRWNIKLISLAKYLLYFVFAITFIYYSPFWDYFVFRINNTLFVFKFMEFSAGNQIDPRTAIVWPQFIAAMNDIGFYSWIIGGNLNLPTDSGLLLLFRESGILGYFIISTLLIYAYKISGKDRLVFCLLAMIVVGSVVNPVIQGYRLLFIFSLVVLVQSMVRMSNGINRTQL